MVLPPLVLPPLALPSLALPSLVLPRAVRVYSAAVPDSMTKGASLLSPG